MVYRITWGSATEDQKRCWIASECDKKWFKSIQCSNQTKYSNWADDSRISPNHGLQCTCEDGSLPPPLPCGHESVSCMRICESWNDPRQVRKQQPPIAEEGHFWTFSDVVIQNGIFYLGTEFSKAQQLLVQEYSQGESLFRNSSFETPPSCLNWVKEPVVLHAPLFLNNVAHILKDNTAHLFFLQWAAGDVSRLLLYDPYQAPENAAFSRIVDYLFPDGVSWLSSGGSACFRKIYWSGRSHYGHLRFPEQHWIHRFHLITTYAEHAAKALGAYHALPPSRYPAVTSTHDTKGNRKKAIKEILAIYMFRGQEYREMENYMDLVDNLSTRNIHTIVCCDWSKTTIADLTQILGNSLIMIGSHGAGLSNMVFMPPGGLVVELTNWRAGESTWFGTLALLTRHTHYLHADMHNRCHHYHGVKKTSYGYNCPISFLEEITDKIQSYTQLILNGTRLERRSGDFCLNPLMNWQCQ